MTADILWGFFILVVLAGVIALMRWLEFDPGFERRMYRLNPNDLRTRTLTDILDGVICSRQVAATRFWYIAFSVVFLVAVSGTMVCSELVRKPVSQVFPQGVLGLLSEAQTQGPRLRSIFWHVILFTIGFHLLPVISVVTSSRSPGKQGSLASGEDRVGRALTALLMFQRWFLDRMITRLLRYRATAPEERWEEDEAGGIQAVVKSRIADFIAKRASREEIEEEYGKLTARIAGPPLGSGAAATLGGQIAGPSEHAMVIGIIDKHGIPYVMRRFRVGPVRTGARRPVSLSFRGTIDGVESEGMIENLGDTGRKERWNSFLLSIPDSANGALNGVRRNIPMRVQAIGGQTCNDALRCVVKRVDRISGNGQVWMGVVVEDDEIRRFGKIARRALHAS